MKQNEINKAEGKIKQTLEQIEIKQQEIITSRKNLEKERRAFRRRMKSHNKKT